MKRIRDGGRKAPTTPMPPDDPDPFGNEHRDDWPACQCGEPLDFRTTMMLCPDCALDFAITLGD